jgi:hypothetical protein
MKSFSWLTALSIPFFCLSYKSCLRFQQSSLTINHRNALYNRADSSSCNSISRVNQNRKYKHNDLHMSTSTSTSSTKVSIPKFIQSANPLTLIKNKCSDIKTFFDVQLPMFQYLWPKNNLKLRFYLVVSFMFMFVGKWLNVKVPFILQRAIDTAASAGICCVFITVYIYTCMHAYI